MKQEIKEVFYCDHCKKHLFRKSAMTRHEKLCLNNPENHKKCLSGCKFLETIEQIVSFGTDYEGDIIYKTVTSFKCAKFDKLMFPFSIERKSLHLRFDTYADQEPMPKECDGFELPKSDIDIFNFNW